jgi:hypothetical protein
VASAAWLSRAPLPDSCLTVGGSRESRRRRIGRRRKPAQAGEVLLGGPARDQPQAVGSCQARTGCRRGGQRWSRPWPFASRPRWSNRRRGRRARSAWVAIKCQARCASLPGDGRDLAAECPSRVDVQAPVLVHGHPLHSACRDRMQRVQHRREIRAGPRTSSRWTSSRATAMAADSRSDTSRCTAGESGRGLGRGSSGQQAGKCQRGREHLHSGRQGGT